MASSDSDYYVSCLWKQFRQIKDNMTLRSTTINIRNYYVVSIIYATIVDIESADVVDDYGWR